MIVVLTGISVHAYRQTRIHRENLASSALETREGYRHVVYWGRQHVTDVDEGRVSKGHLKVGKSVSATSIMRGRNEGGGDFKIYAEMVYDETTYATAEHIVHLFLNPWAQAGDHGQQELFNISNKYLFEKINHCLVYLNQLNFSPREVLLFCDNCWCAYEPGKIMSWYTPGGRLVTTSTNATAIPSIKKYTAIEPTDHSFLEW